MGEVAVKLLSIAGLIGYVIGFISNLPNPISLLLGMIGLAYGIYKTLEKREEWLQKRSERRMHERENQTLRDRQKK